MKSVTVPSRTFNLILMPGQTKEDIIEAVKNMSEFGYPEAECVEFNDVRAKIDVTVTDGRLTTAVTLQGIDSRIHTLGRAV